MVDVVLVGVVGEGVVDFVDVFGGILGCGYGGFGFVGG